MAEITPVTEKDYAALATFLSGSPEMAAPLDFWRGRFKVWWEGNPAFPAPGLERGWALRSEGKIAGFIGSVPSQILLGGKPAVAVNSTTWIVAPDRRGSMAALGLLTKQLEESKDRLLVNATPTPPVVAIIERLGYRPLPGGGERESFLFLDAAAAARASLGRLSMIPGIARAAGLALAARQATRLRLESPLQAKILDDYSADLDALWERTKGAYDTTNARTADVLRWHCRDEAFPKTLLGCFEGSRLCGFMILRPKKRRGLSVLECCDLWGEADKARPSLAALVSLARERAAAGGHQMLMLPHFTKALGAFYGSLGLIEGPAPARKAYYKASPELVSLVENGRAYFTGLQGDAGSAP